MIGIVSDKWWRLQSTIHSIVGNPLIKLLSQRCVEDLESCKTWRCQSYDVSRSLGPLIFLIVLQGSKGKRLLRLGSRSEFSYGSF